MSDKDESQTSRRARRRAERERAESEEAKAAAEAAEGEDVEGEGDGDGEDDEEREAAADEASEESAEEAPAPRAPNRAERRAARKKKAEGEASSASDIRDRNVRLREKAAQRRREKRERETAVARGLDAGEMVDDALARATHGATEFIRKHFNIVQWVIVLGIAGGIGWQIWSWRYGKNVAKASDELMQAVAAEQGLVGRTLDPALEGLVPTFDTDEARLKQAEEEYREALELREGSGTAILAKLGLAGVLYDQGKHDEAIAAYEEVKGSELAKHDADVRVRALEGIGLSQEAKGDTDAALKTFRELENSEVPGMKALGLLHQARVSFSKGEKDKAKELAKQAQEHATKELSPYQTAGYLDSASRELLAAIDPSLAPPTSAPAYSQEEIDALRDQIMKDPTKLEKMLKDLGKSVPQVPDMPPIQLPEPTGEAPEAP